MLDSTQTWFRECIVTTVETNQLIGTMANIGFEGFQLTNNTVCSHTPTSLRQSCTEFEQKLDLIFVDHGLNSLCKS